MKLYKDTFDSKIFSRQVYKLFLEEEIRNEKRLLHSLKKKPIDILYCFTIFSDRNIDILEKNNFQLASIRNSYGFDLDSYLPSSPFPLPPSSPIKIISKNSDFPHISSRDVDRFVDVLLPMSRYSKDKNISRRLGSYFYKTWIENSLLHNFADGALLALDNDCIVGMLTYKIKGHAAYIDLIAILEKYQNKRLGKSILQQLILLLKTKKIRRLCTVTEGENIQANIFYQKNGFVIQAMQLVYHKHYI